MNKKFKITYSAPTESEREEIEKIKNEYLENKDHDKLQQLRKLDNKVKNIPNALAFTLGIVGVLIFGLGFTMILEWGFLICGIVVSLLGVIPIVCAYPIYNKVYDRLKRKYRDQILSLSDELLNLNTEK